MKEVVALEDRAPHRLPTFSLYVSVDARGRFYAPAETRDRILVFDRTGRVQAVVGTRGDGAGQFQWISHLVTGPRGEQLVFDARRRTLTAIAADLTLGGEVGASYTPTFVLSGGGFVSAQQILTADLIGHPIHVVDNNGRVTRSFGAEPPEFRQDLRLINERLVAPASDGTVWAISPGRYVIERWSPTSGARLARYVVISPWFTESHDVAPPGTKPTPIIESLWEDKKTIWVLIRDADRKWAHIPVPLETPYDPQRYDRTYDWVLEAVDPESGSVLASRRFDSALWGRPSSPLLVSQRPLQIGGSSAYIVWQPELKRKGK